MKHDKGRDMARGALASTARRGVREDKRDFHHTHRRAQNQINHEIMRSTTVIDDDGHLFTDPDLFDDFEPRHVIDGYSAGTKKEGVGYDDMREVVSHRRNHDKLGPLLAWARATERQIMNGWAVADKYAYFKAVLPDTLPGRHALDHIETMLDLSPDEYDRWWLYARRRTPPVTIEQFRAALNRILSTAKGRRELRDFLLETVPVASHTTETNNMKRSSVVARDEHGKIRYHPERPGIARWVTPRAIYVDVYIPQVVPMTCGDCAFLRNDPLATPVAVKRFIDIVWNHKHVPRAVLMNSGAAHYYLGAVRDYVINNGRRDSA